jgi:hypothetical protein
VNYADHAGFVARNAYSSGMRGSAGEVESHRPRALVRKGDRLRAKVALQVYQVPSAHVAKVLSLERGKPVEGVSATVHQPVEPAGHMHWRPRVPVRFVRTHHSLGSAVEFHELSPITDARAGIAIICPMRLTRVVDAGAGDGVAATVISSGARVVTSGARAVSCRARGASQIGAAV